MAKCRFCSKQQVSGNKVSHSNIKTRTKNNPNVQRFKVVIGTKTQRAWICTRCIRSGKVVRATPRSVQAQVQKPAPTTASA